MGSPVHVFIPDLITCIELSTKISGPSVVCVYLCPLVVEAARGVYHKPLAECLEGVLTENIIFLKKQKMTSKSLTVGAGTGLIGTELQKLGYSNLHALDIPPEMLKEAKKRNIYKRFFCVGLSDQQISEIQTGEFDGLICAGTLLTGHIRAAAFEEMVRMVKHGIMTNH